MKMMTLFMAGHETTANALTWSLYLLARNPEVDARLGEAAPKAIASIAMRVACREAAALPARVDHRPRSDARRNA